MHAHPPALLSCRGVQHTNCCVRWLDAPTRGDRRIAAAISCTEPSKLNGLATVTCRGSYGLTLRWKSTST
jgi:hypothetical protein